MTIDPEMTRREVLLLLRDRETPPDLLRAVAENRDWMGYQEIRRALARRAGRTLIGALIDCATGRELQGLLGNPRTPVPAALRSLRGLSTRDV